MIALLSGTRRRYCQKRVASPRAFDRRSFRTIKRGRATFVVGCPRGKYKRGRCKVGTRLQAILKPRGKYSGCPVGYK